VEGSSTEENPNTGDLVVIPAVTKRLDLAGEQWARREPSCGPGRTRADAAGTATRIPLACEQSRKVLSPVVTAGQRGDSPRFQAVPDGQRERRESPSPRPPRPSRS
jgi:hypothetical protein